MIKVYYTLGIHLVLENCIDCSNDKVRYVAQMYWHNMFSVFLKIFLNRLFTFASNYCFKKNLRKET